MSQKQIPSEELPLVGFFDGLFWLVSRLNFHVWFTYHLDRNTNEGLNKARRCLDIYMLVWTVVLIAFLVVLTAVPPWCVWLFVGWAIWRLVEVTVITLYDITRKVKHPCKDEWGRFIYGASRQLLLGLLTVFQIVLGFAVVFLAWGEEFTPAIERPLVAFYQSLLTFTTLGYGDIRPAETDQIVRSFVCWELCLFILTLVIRLPRTLTLIGYRDVEPCVHKRTK